MDNKSNNGRREFVKQSSLIAGGLLAAPFMSNANFFSGADDVIKVALIGAVAEVPALPCRRCLANKM